MGIISHSQGSPLSSRILSGVQYLKSLFKHSVAWSHQLTVSKYLIFNRLFTTSSATQWISIIPFSIFIFVGFGYPFSPSVLCLGLGTWPYTLYWIFSYPIDPIARYIEVLILKSLFPLFVIPFHVCSDLHCITLLLLFCISLFGRVPETVSFMHFCIPCPFANAPKHRGWDDVIYV